GVAGEAWMVEGPYGSHVLRRLSCGAHMGDSMPMMPHVPLRFQSIFSPATVQGRQENFECYWQFIQSKTGELLETARDLSKKRATLEHFQTHAVLTCQPLPIPAAFYRTCLTLRGHLTPT